MVRVSRIDCFQGITIYKHASEPTDQLTSSELAWHVGLCSPWWIWACRNPMQSLLFKGPHISLMQRGQFSISSFSVFLTIGQGKQQCVRAEGQHRTLLLLKAKAPFRGVQPLTTCHYLRRCHTPLGPGISAEGTKGLSFSYGRFWAATVLAMCILLLALVC